MAVMAAKAAVVFGLIFAPIPGAAEEWRFVAGEVSSVFAEGREKTLLQGGARVSSDTKEIDADTLELFGSGLHRMEGNGNVVVRDLEEGITISAQKVEYDRDAGILRFRERVVLEDENEGLVIRCESLENRENENLVFMQVSVRLIKDDLVCRGEFALYRRDDDMLEISGMPVVWRDEDEYRAERIRVNLDTEEIILEGDVAGSLTTGEETGQETGEETAGEE
jgi:lipopolysaccharide export system protein LptA